MDHARPSDRMEELLEHRAWVRRVARALVRDEARADDLEQEVWLDALRADPPRSPRAWLGTVLRRISSSMRRDEGRRRTRDLGGPLPPPPPDPSEWVLRAEVVERVARAVRTLDEPYRTAVFLRYFEDLPPPAIAARLSVPLETVRTRLRRALALLRERLDGEDGGERRRWVLLLAPLGQDPAPSPAPIPVSAPGLATGAALSLGGLLMKKAIAAAVVVLLLALAWVSWPTKRGIEEGRPEAGSPAHDGGAVRNPGPPVPAAPVADAVEEEWGPMPPSSPLTGPRATGIVVDEAGRGIAGARVFSFPFDAPRALRAVEAVGEGAPGRLASADAEGRFVLPLAPGAPRWTLIAQAAGFEPFAAVGIVEGADVRIRLERSSAIAGRVLDLQGRPVVGARIRMVRVLDALSWERTAISGPEGRYRLAGLPRKALQEFGQPFAARLLVEVLAEGFAPLRLRRLPVVEKAGGEASFDFVLVPGSTVRGKVVEQGTDRAIPGARVVLWTELRGTLVRPDGARLAAPASPAVVGETVAGEDGSFAIDHVPLDGPYPPVWLEGQLRLGAGKEGWVTISTYPKVMGTMEPMEQVLSLVPAAAVRGRVVDGSGQPVAGVWVLVVSLAAQLPPPLAGLPPTAVRTGEDGSYALAAIPAGREKAETAEIQARRVPLGEGIAWAAVDGAVTVEARAGETLAAPDIVLGEPRPGAAVDFLVTDAAGTPVWGASLVAGSALQMRSASARPLGTPGFEERTDAAGRARLWWPLEKNPRGNPLEGPQPVRISAPGFATRLLDVRPGLEPVEEVRVTLDPGHTLTGRVLEAGGGPAAEAWVSVLDASFPLETAFPPGGTWLFPPEPRKGTNPVLSIAQTDADGAFSIPDLREGPWNVVAAKSPRNPGVYPAHTPVLRAERTGIAGDTADLLLQLPADTSAEGGTVVGTVLDAESGERVFRFQAELRRGEALAGAGWDAVVGGTFRIVNVPPGRWTLRVSAPQEYAPVEVEGVEVVAGPQPAPLVVRLQRGARVTGRIASPGGEAVAGGKVDLIGISAGTGPPLSTGNVGRDGAFVVHHVAPGKYRLVLRDAPGGLTLAGGAERLVEVPEGAAEVRVDGLLQPAGRLMVEIKDPRFPMNAWKGTPASAEQEAVSRESRLEVRDASGSLLRELRDLQQGWVMNGELLPAGECTVRLLLPAGEVRERRVTIEAATGVGSRPASVSFGGE